METSTLVFSGKICQIIKNIYFEEDLRNPVSTFFTPKCYTIPIKILRF